MIVEYEYSKEVNCCQECPYYAQDNDMGAIIPICVKGGAILDNPHIISNKCPIVLTESKLCDELKPSPHIENIEPMKCNCQDEKADIDNTIRMLKIVQYCWADQIPYENQKISDCEAITQVIKCLEEYKESCERVKNATNH